MWAVHLEPSELELGNTTDLWLLVSPNIASLAIFWEFYKQSLKYLQIWVLESISKMFHRQNVLKDFKRLCHQETYWIFTLDRLLSRGMNEKVKISTVF